MERGVAVEAGCCCWLLWERTRSVIITRWKVHGIYSNNLVRTDHVCSCLVISAAREWIDQSHDDRYPVYWFTAYQRDTGWSYHQLWSVTRIRFTCSVGDRSSSTLLVWEVLLFNDFTFGLSPFAPNYSTSLRCGYSFFYCFILSLIWSFTRSLF